MVLKSGFVRVVFRIKTLNSFNPSIDTACIIIEKGTFVMGSETLKTSFIGGNMWLIETYLLKSEEIRYKLAMFSHISNDFSDKENFWRVLQTTSGHPVMVELTYNTETELSRGMKSHLTTSGEAYNVHVSLPGRGQDLIIGDQTQTPEGATAKPVGQDLQKECSLCSRHRKDAVLEITRCTFTSSDVTPPKKTIIHRRVLIFTVLTIIVILCLMVICGWIGSKIVC